MFKNIFYTMLIKRPKINIIKYMKYTHKQMYTYCYTTL